MRAGKTRVNCWPAYWSAAPSVKKISGDMRAFYLVSRVQISNDVLCGRHKNGRLVLPILTHLTSTR